MDAWNKWLRESVKAGRLKCFGGCGDVATVAKATGKHTGAWCRGCYNELTYGTIPPLDKPKGLRSPVRSRKRLMA